VEIITAKGATPNPSWSSFLVTAKARAAIRQYLKNLKRGEALELDDAATYGFFPAVYYFQGKVRQGLKSRGAADSFRNYLNIREKAGEDPLLPEVRRLAAQ